MSTFQACCNNRNKKILYITFYHIYITSHSVDIKTHFGGTPLNSLSLITISLEWVHELSSFMLKRILKYTVIKMHSASFFINGLNVAYKMARCDILYFCRKRQTNNLVPENMGPFVDTVC